VLVEVGVRPAHTLNEEVFRVAKSADALTVWRMHEIDLFSAILQDPALGSNFADIRYRQMREQLEALRR
jgi:hypothetical protein